MRGDEGIDGNLPTLRDAPPEPTMPLPSPGRPFADRAAEAAVLAAVVLAPWAFGSVEAWAEWLLYLLTAAAATLAALGGRRDGWRRRLLCGPSLALLGLVALAIVQATPLPDPLFRRIDPAAAEILDRLIPDQTGRVVGDPLPPVADPSRTISRSPESTRDVAARLLAAWLLLQAVLGLGGGTSTYRRFCRVVAINATALALFAMVQALSWNGKIYWLRPSPMPSTHGWFTGGPFVAHGPLAAYLNLGLGLAVGLLMAGRRRGDRVGWAYAAGVLAFGVVASQARGAFVGMAVAAVAGIALIRPTGRRAWAGLAGVGCLIVLLLIAVGTASPMARVASIVDGEATGLSVRLDLWRASLDAWKDAPAWGYGLGAFEVAVAPRLDRDLGLVFRRAENEYLDLLVEGGLVGLGLSLALLATVARLGVRAWRSRVKASSEEAPMILGGLLGLLALAVHCLGDFSPHIPGLSVVALALCGHLARLGLAVGETAEVPSPAVRRWRLAPAMAMAMAMAAGAVVIGHGWWRVRAESSLARAGLPLVEHSTRLDGILPADATVADLERTRDALTTALRFRPDWAAARLLLGRTDLELYRLHAARWIEEGGGSAEDVAIMADPLWLHAITRPGIEGVGDPIDHEPVRSHLVPAARCFLEARRACPMLAEPHAGLAALDFLLIGDDPGPMLADRADRLAGADVPMLGRLARLAADEGRDATAARRWRRMLVADPDAWEAVADAALALLPADQVLVLVVPEGDGRTALRFADRLDPGDGARVLFLEAAVAWLPGDDRLDPADRLDLEATALRGLGRDGAAAERLADALLLRPEHLGRRRTLVQLLIDRGDLDEARRHALIGLSDRPDDPVLRRALDRIADRKARGDLAAGPSIGAGGAQPPGVL